MISYQVNDDLRCGDNEMETVKYRSADETGFLEKSPVKLWRRCGYLLPSLLPSLLPALLHTFFPFIWFLTNFIPFYFSIPILIIGIRQIKEKVNEICGAEAHEKSIGGGAGGGDIGLRKLDGGRNYSLSSFHLLTRGFAWVESKESPGVKRNKFTLLKKQRSRRKPELFWSNLSVVHPDFVVTRKFIRIYLINLLPKACQAEQTFSKLSVNSLLPVSKK